MNSINIRKNSIYKLYRFFVLLLFLDSMYPWYMWGNSLSFITRIATAITFVLIWIQSPKLLSMAKENRSQVFLILLYFACYFLFWGGSIGLVAVALNFIGITLMKDEVKIDIFNFLLKWLGIIVGISLVAYIVWVVGMNLPHYTIKYGDGQYYADNYYLFIIGHTGKILSFTRFQSIFMEPGHMTMGLVPFIIASRFNLKNKYVLTLFLAEIMSLSLAAILSLFFGYVLLSVGKGGVKKIIIGFVVVLGIIFSFDKFGGTDILQDFLWQRIEITDGSLAGYNRTKANFEFEYERLMHSSKKWLGDNTIERNQGDGGNAGYMVYIVQTGIIGLSLAFNLYFFLFFFYKKKAPRVLIIINILLISQSGGPTWFCCYAAYVLCSLYASIGNNIISNKDGEIQHNLEKQTAFLPEF